MCERISPVVGSMTSFMMWLISLWSRPVSVVGAKRDGVQRWVTCCTTGDSGAACVVTCVGPCWTSTEDLLGVTTEWVVWHLLHLWLCLRDTMGWWCGWFTHPQFLGGGGL